MALEGVALAGAFAGAFAGALAGGVGALADALPGAGCTGVGVAAGATVLGVAARAVVIAAVVESCGSASASSCERSRVSCEPMRITIAIPTSAPAPASSRRFVFTAAVCREWRIACSTVALNETDVGCDGPLKAARTALRSFAMSSAL